MRTIRRLWATTDSKHSFAVASNLLNGQFIACGWPADRTYMPIGEAWPSLAAALDLFSSKVVGSAIGETMIQEMTIIVLRLAATDHRPS